MSKIENHFLNNPNASVRHSAQKLGVAKSTLSYAKVHLLGLHAYAKQPFPKYRDGQEQRAKSNCGRIRRKARGRIFIMDDESAGFADPQQIPGKAFYHAASRNRVPPQARVKLTEKFSKNFPKNSWFGNAWIALVTFRSRWLPRKPWMVPNIKHA